MSEERNLGVTEARLGLTILSCLLVALGYFVLQRMGDPAESTPDIYSTGAPGSFSALPVAEPSGADTQSQILPVQGSEPSPLPYPQMTMRPLWLSPQHEADDIRLQRFDPTEPAQLVHEQSLFDSRRDEPPPNSKESRRY